jgi:hypothetical protein
MAEMGADMQEDFTVFDSDNDEPIVTVTGPAMYARKFKSECIPHAGFFHVCHLPASQARSDPHEAFLAAYLVSCRQFDLTELETIVQLI